VITDAVVCMHMHIYVYVYVCMWPHINMYVCIMYDDRMHMHTCMSSNIHTTCMYAYMLSHYTCCSTCTKVCIYILNMYTQTYVYETAWLSMEIKKY